MSKTSTNQDIVKYVYNELEEEKQNQFNFKYLTDSKIRNEVEMISNTKKVLDNLLFNPSDSVIKRIKDFSSALNFAEKIN
ncbi:MAG: hypothetical protein CL869_02255 [Cytophagia bacterium]|nr:hypothetical protein [Cytophagia bacterium]|tara:strand:- start:856 stop:1095 length:240 start_codon:yes stop_codon:yes gene_type:complete